MRKRNHAITIRMNDQEYEMMKKKVEESGQTKQTYIVNAILGATLLPKDAINELKETNRLLAEENTQLRGIAVNVNQLARFTNRVGIAPQFHELFEIQELLQKDREEHNELWQSIRQLLIRQRAMAG
ncbi:MAG: plasmid mobilization relaxosome protein MobC [Anaerobutyricum hallii]|uniref:plasmid mobilization protein n=1 Tax=Anaerobutyricum hallii TaxID=39488 RepID=UPI002432A524|nr:plasmid mobilization relaxosome protein MobC [Anaerobutyricum hallii]MDD6587991.1 plasmid mobilization relaxosome protein MobC [Anaerobutyricum hallii]